jgi:hypothetical protein
MIHENPWIQHDTSYPPARGPVLLLTCMDIRLLDEVVRFMDHDGQTNRYDHLILAGAALGALGGKAGEYCHWQETFDEHLQIAYIDKLPSLPGRGRGRVQSRGWKARLAAEWKRRNDLKPALF